MCARLFVKGAAEMVLDLCTQQVDHHHVHDQLPADVGLHLPAARVPSRFKSRLVTFRWDQTAACS
jgi:hypothetical protein